MFLIFLLAVRMSSASSPFPTPQQNAESSKKKKTTCVHAGKTDFGGGLSGYDSCFWGIFKRKGRVLSSSFALRVPQALESVSSVGFLILSPVLTVLSTVLFRAEKTSV